MKRKPLLREFICAVAILIGCSQLAAQKPAGKGSGGDAGGDTSDKGDSKGGGQGKGQNTKDASGNGAGGNSGAPFEAQMLAYGAADQIAQAISKGVCNKIKGTKATIIIYDQTSFGSVQTYGGFEATVAVLLAAYNATKSAIKPAEAAVSPLDVASLILQYSSASTTENASGVTLSDDAVKMSIVHYLRQTSDKTGCDATKITVIYPPVAMQLAGSKGAISDIATKLLGLAKARSDVGALIAESKKDPNDSLVLRYQDTNKAYDQFITSLYTKDSNTGQFGMASVVNGHDLYNLLHSEGTYILFEEAVAGGGTQRVKKNLFTNIFWGDLIRYSGGGVITFALVDGPTSSVAIANTIRFRTPNTSVGKPNEQLVKEAKAGENLSAVN